MSSASRALMESFLGWGGYFKKGFGFPLAQALVQLAPEPISVIPPDPSAYPPIGCMDKCLHLVMASNRCWNITYSWSLR